MRQEFVNTEKETSGKADLTSSYKCSRCNNNDAQQEHTCPYAEEINGDCEGLCDCCTDCEHECYMDI